MCVENKNYTEPSIGYEDLYKNMTSTKTEVPKFLQGVIDYIWSRKEKCPIIIVRETINHQHSLLEHLHLSQKIIH